MDFTFGIITTGQADSFVNQCIDSIEAQGMPRYEVIVVGNSKVSRKFTRVIPFDENQKRMWITRKKNIITQMASYDNVVYAHDYLAFNIGWYNGWREFGDFQVGINPMVCRDGSRFRDWTLHFESVDPHGVPRLKYLLPYEVQDLSRFMYISGSYWVAKRSLMAEFPLNESLVWGHGEDVEWSMRIRKSHDFRLNTRSTTRLLKDKHPIFEHARPEDIEKLRGIR